MAEEEKGRRLCESALCLLSSHLLLPDKEGGTVLPSKEMRFGLLCKDPTKVPPAGLAHSLKVSKLVQHLHTYDCREGPMDYAGENVAHRSQAMEETLLSGSTEEKSVSGVVPHSSRHWPRGSPTLGSVTSTHHSKALRQQT